MSIPTKIAEITGILDKVRKYNDLIIGDSFEEDTVADMQGNAKDLCDDAKDDIDDIKDLIDAWE